MFRFIKISIFALSMLMCAKADNASQTFIYDDAVLNDIHTKVDLIQTKIELQNLKHCKCQNEEQATNHTDPETEYSNLPTNCAEAFGMGGTTSSGQYKIFLPKTGLPPFKVYCLQDPYNTGSPWMIIQRRQNGYTNFYRDWDEYKSGFGFLSGEFFIGLEKLHLLTHSQEHELWIKLEDFEGQVRNAKYDLFAIGGANTKYALNILGGFHGDVGDSLRIHLGMKFSTRNSDNDLDYSKCAENYHGAWWYNKCHESNLNGKYLSGTFAANLKGQGITWYSWRGDNYSLKYVHMAIRPVNSK